MCARLTSSLTAASRRRDHGLVGKPSNGADGMAVDAVGRLFVVMNEGVRVFESSGSESRHDSDSHTRTECRFWRAGPEGALYRHARRRVQGRHAVRKV